MAGAKDDRHAADVQLLTDEITVDGLAGRDFHSVHGSPPDEKARGEQLR